jgi:hypothetical protein
MVEDLALPDGWLGITIDRAAYVYIQKLGIMPNAVISRLKALNPNNAYQHFPANGRPGHNLPQVQVQQPAQRQPE